MVTFISVLGEAAEIAPEMQAIIHANSIDASDFPESLTKYLPNVAKWKLPESEISNRRDLRHERIFTCDPRTCRDMDDALHIKKLSSGNYQIGVHIADVSYHVSPNSKLDNIARERSTTVYMVGKVVTMLPRALSEKLCSLEPDTDRPAFSVIWEITEAGDIVNEW